MLKITHSVNCLPGHPR